MTRISFDFRTFKLGIFLCHKKSYDSLYYGDHVIVSDQQEIKIRKPTKMVSFRVDNEYLPKSVPLLSVNLIIYFAELFNQLKGLKEA